MDVHVLYGCDEGGLYKGLLCAGFVALEDGKELFVSDEEDRKKATSLENWSDGLSGLGWKRHLVKRGREGRWRGVRIFVISEATGDDGVGVRDRHQEGYEGLSSIRFAITERVFIFEPLVEGAHPGLRS